MSFPLKIVVFFVLVAMILLAAKSLLKEREPEGIAPRRYTVTKTEIEQAVYGSGALRCSRRAEIASRVAGKLRVEDVFIEEGDAVEASKTLCKIANEQVEEELRQQEKEYTLTQLDYTAAQEEYQDKKKMYEVHKSPSEVELKRLERELERKKLALEKVEKALETLREKVGFLTVKSPLAGTVLKTNLKASEISLDPDRLYAEGTLLFVVGDLSSLTVYGTILESDRSKVEAGKPAVVQCGKKGWLPAKVSYLSLIPSAASEGGRYEIHLEFENPQPDLKEGQLVDFRIIVEKKSDVLAVPVQYVKAEGGRHWVKRVEGKKVTRIPIEVGISSYSLYEVKSGLKKGDIIQWDAEGKD